MFRKFFLFCTVLMILLTGCSALDHDSKEELAESFIEAVIDDDQQAVWEGFSPETQSRLITMFGDDEERAKAETLRAMREGLQRKYGQEDLEELAGNDELFQQAVSDLAAAGNFVEIDGEWFIGLPAGE